MADNLIIRNTSLYNDPDGNNNYDILISKGKIDMIRVGGKPAGTYKSLEAKGLMAIPGLIDIHLHGAGGSDTMEGTGEALSIISCTLAKLGITGFLSTILVKPGKENPHLVSVAKFTGKDLGGAELLGSYIEGPFINREKKGGISEEYISRPSPSVLDRIMAEADGSLKVMCLAPEIAGNTDIIRRLTAAGVKASFGHSAAGYEETLKGFEEGITHVTHLYNAMNPIHHRVPGPLAAIFECPGISLELISDGCHVHPSLVRIAGKLAGNKRVVCVTDGINGMGLPEGSYYYNNRQYVSKNGLAMFTDGTLIGTTMDLLDIAKSYMNITSVNFSEALDTVTINPARILGIDQSKGTIEQGKDADLVLLDDSLRVKYTITGGRLVYQNTD